MTAPVIYIEYHIISVYLRNTQHMVIFACAYKRENPPSSATALHYRVHKDYFRNKNIKKMIVRRPPFTILQIARQR